jgi:hypothetical protein
MRPLLRRKLAHQECNNSHGFVASTTNSPHGFWIFGAKALAELLMARSPFCRKARHADGATGERTSVQPRRALVVASQPIG